MVADDKVMLHIPEVDLDPEMDMLLSNPKMVEELKQCVMNWQTKITIVMEEQLNKKPQVGDFPYTLCKYQQPGVILYLKGGTSGQTETSHVRNNFAVMYNFFVCLSEQKNINRQKKTQNTCNIHVHINVKNVNRHLALGPS